jgi:hypothetical protein
MFATKFQMYLRCAGTVSDVAKDPNRYRAIDNRNRRRQIDLNA